MKPMQCLSVVVFVCVLLGGWCPVATAQCECGCDAVLVPAVQIRTAKKEVQLSYLLLVNAKTFEVMKKSYGGGADLDLKIFAIGANMTYEQFVAKRTELFKQENFNLTVKEATATLNSGLPKEVVAAWSKCKEDCIAAREKTGLYSRVTYADAERIIVATSWHPPAPLPKNPQPLKVKWTATGGEFAGDKHEEIQPNGMVIHTFKRNAGKPFSLVVNGGGGVAHNLNLQEPAPPAAPRIVGNYRLISTADHRNSREARIAAVQGKPDRFRLTQKFNAGEREKGIEDLGEVELTAGGS